MPDSVIKYKDIKGEKGHMKFDGVDVDESVLGTHLNGLSYCGFYEKSLITASPLTTKPVADGSPTLLENDKDVKCYLTFKDVTADEIIKWTIPAPKINVDGGIQVVNGTDRRFVPESVVNGTQKNGTELAASIKAILGRSANVIIFMSGHIGKRP